MAEIVLFRIDDRLLHGQVSKRWLKEVGANTIIVADDKVAGDEETIAIMDVATPLGVKSYFLSIKDAIEKLKHLEKDARAILLVKNPEMAFKIVDQGLNVDKINMGNKSRISESKEIAPSIYLTNEDIGYLKDIENEGVEIIILSLPDDKLVEFDTIK